MVDRKSRFDSFARQHRIESNRSSAPHRRSSFERFAQPIVARFGQARVVAFARSSAAHSSIGRAVESTDVSCEFRMVR
jgi:hypothetical protein